MCQRNRGNFQIHGANTDTLPPQLGEALCSLLIKRQDYPGRKKAMKRRRRS